MFAQQLVKRSAKDPHQEREVRRERRSDPRLLYLAKYGFYGGDFVLLVRTLKKWLG